MALSLGEIYQLPILCYPSLLQCLNGINDGLKRDGIPAPSNQSLVKTRQLYEILGRPLDGIAIVHVGGTNGKGSTCFKTAGALTAAGLVTGLFVSPHLSSFRERIQINGVMISEESIIEMSTIVFQECIRSNIPATLFEVTFLIAASYYKDMKCDVVVLEVGMGGELDATNVIIPALSIICSVSLDHTRILGSTVEEIAKHKAGIFKRDSYALVGNDAPQELLQQEAIRRGAAWHGVDSVLAENGFASWLAEDPDTDARNSRLALAAILLLEQRGIMRSIALNLHDPNILNGLRSRPPCRWELVQVPVTTTRKVRVQCILDVGHNPAAINALSQRIYREYSGRQYRVVYAMSRDKDVRTCLQHLLHVVPKDWIYFAEANSFRKLARSELQNLFLELTGEPMKQFQLPELDQCVFDLITSLLNEIASSAMASGVAEGDVAPCTLIVCGTFFIMPDVRKALGIVEPRDTDDLRRLSTK